MNDAQFQVSIIQKSLIGCKIVGTMIDKDEEFFGFTVEQGRGKNKVTKTVWVDSDDEGNGCGSLKVDEEGTNQCQS
jgi:hypothetical protein